MLWSLAGAFMRRLGVDFARNKSGNYAVITALASVPLFTGVSVAIDYSNASRMRSELQQRLDASVLAGAAAESGQVAAAEAFFRDTFQNLAKNKLPGSNESVVEARFQLGDGVIDGWASQPMEVAFGFGLSIDDKEIAVRSQARFVVGESAVPCITVLADVERSLLVNSGASIDGKTCEINVHSRKSQAMMMNAGSELNVAKTCVASNNIRNNGGKIGGLETGCSVPADPYAGKIPEPTVPGSCTTSGPKNPGTYSIKPGLHCDLTFNGSANVTFEPGLHIIRGTMHVNSGSTVNAQGVTFYFPNTDSKIQFNGELTLVASAPASGTYKGILMFEKTSDASNNSKKRDFIFNGSKSEKIEGAIYLPNRNVTYNAKTNINAAKTALVVNKLIINQASWKLDGMSGGGSGERMVYLSR